MESVIMTEKRKFGLQLVLWVFFIGGLHLFLNETHSTGEALQTFKLILPSSTIPIVCGAVALLAALGLVIMHVLLRKKSLNDS